MLKINMTINRFEASKTNGFMEVVYDKTSNKMKFFAAGDPLHMSKEETGKLYDWLKKNIKKMTHKSRELTRSLEKKKLKEIENGREEKDEQEENGS